MIELMGKEVEVLANYITYTGKLVEISETELYLQGELGWVVIPLEKVEAVKERVSDQLFRSGRSFFRSR